MLRKKVQTEQSGEASDSWSFFWRSLQSTDKNKISMAIVPPFKGFSETRNVRVGFMIWDRDLLLYFSSLVDLQQDWAKLRQAGHPGCNTGGCALCQTQANAESAPDSVFLKYARKPCFHCPSLGVVSRTYHRKLGLHYTNLVVRPQIPNTVLNKPIYFFFKAKQSWLVLSYLDTQPHSINVAQLLVYGSPMVSSGAQKMLALETQFHSLQWSH